MARFLFARLMFPPPPRFPSTISKYCSSFWDPFKSVEQQNEPCTQAVCNNSTPTPTPAPTPTNRYCGIKLPTLIPTDASSNHLEGFNIELVDHNIWPQALAGMDESAERMGSLEENHVFDEMPNRNSEEEEFADFDVIEDLRLRKKLFYKLDRGSKEFEEYNINFHQKKSLKKEREKPAKVETKKECKKPDKQSKPEVKKERKGLDKANDGPKLKGKTLCSLENEKHSSGSVKELAIGEKRVRTLTFNQLTAPYHLPFCLDIFITKGSVRASIIHRATSKVVAVAHSISKDLKFDLNSRKDAKACATVGVVLAQRAIEDDIHNVVYTPRKGDKIEGKLQIVLQSIIDNGVDVKVKLKQKRHKKVRLLFSFLLFEH